MPAYLYILASKRNGTLYVGATRNLIQRVYAHKNGQIKGFTYKYNVNKLVYFEEYAYYNDAFTRERRVKNWNRQWKINLIEELNPYWNDLYEALL